MHFFKTKPLMAAILVVSLGLTPSFVHLQARESVTTYSVVQDECLKTCAHEKKDKTPKEQEPKQKNETELVVAELSTYDLYDIVSSMFVKHGTLANHEGVIDPIFVRKMELLCGGEAVGKNLLNQLVPADTVSVFGRVGFASKLINPTTDIEELHKRQVALATFNNMLKDAKLNRSLAYSFEKITEAQKEAIRYWQDEPEMNKKLFQRFYFGKYLNWINKSTVTLELFTRLRNLGTSIGLSMPIIIWASANAAWITKVEGRELSKTQALWEGLKKIKDQLSYLSFYKKSFKDTTLKELQQKYNPYSEIFKQKASPQSIGDLLHCVETAAEQEGYSPTTVKLGILAYSGLIIGTQVYQAKQIIDVARLNTLVTNHIHEQLIGVATCVREANKLYTFLSEQEETAQLPAVQQLGKFFGENATCSSNLSSLLNMLQKNTFKGEPSHFTITGRVLAAHTLMNEVKDEFIPLFEALGHIEADLAAARLFTNHKDKAAQFCFAEFAVADNPTVVMKNFWNPFINADVVVTNNAAFNSFGIERNVILTGPNTAGKSTVIKGVALNILLAQTFGICAAEQARLTPFSIMNCHLNITDDIATGSSLFHAEVKRAKALLDDVQSLSKDQFCFTVMDEVFNGTNAEGGSQAAYKFSDQLGQHQNLILVIATHFGNMTDLEQTGNFKNLHVGAHLDESGSLIRPFKLQPGIFRDPENKILQAILENEGIFETQVAAAA